MQEQLPVIKIPGPDYSATGQREAFLTQAFVQDLWGGTRSCPCTLYKSLKDYVEYFSNVDQHQNS